MPRRLFGLAAVTLAILLPVSPAAAQDGSRVQMEIARTDERIELAESVVAGSGDERAQQSLSAAVNLQAAAKRYFASSQFAAAMRSTQDARIRADAAIAIVRGQPDPERVHMQVERTRELIERARPRVEECSDERARTVLRAASELQDRAEAALDGQRFLAALRLTLSARERAWRALRICQLQDEPSDTVEHALQRTDEILDRARTHISDGGSDAARAALRQAEELQSRGWAEFRADHPAVALRMTRSARAGAQRAVRIADGGR